MSSMTAALITKRKMITDAQRKEEEAKRKVAEAKQLHSISQKEWFRFQRRRQGSPPMQCKEAPTWCALAPWAYPAVVDAMAATAAAVVSAAEADLRAAAAESRMVEASAVSGRAPSAAQAKKTEVAKAVANEALKEARSHELRQRDKARQASMAAHLAMSAANRVAKKKREMDKAAVVAWWAANEEKVSPYQTPINPPPEHSLFGPDSDEEKVSPHRSSVGRPPRYGLFEDDPDDEVNGGRRKRKTRRHKAKKSKNIHRKKSKGTRKKRRTRKGRR